MSSGDEVTADPARAARATTERFRAAGIGYWLHLDVDVLGEDVFPATDYLMPDGLDLAALAAVLAPLGADDASARRLDRLLQPVEGPGRPLRRRARRPARGVRSPRSAGR